MYFGVFAYLDEAGIRSQKIGVTEYVIILYWCQVNYLIHLSGKNYGIKIKLNWIDEFYNEIKEVILAG